jgi:hypothetical protein
MSEAMRIGAARAAYDASTDASSARRALLEIAAECGLNAAAADDAIRQAVVVHIVNAGSRIRFLESTLEVHRAHRIPHLEGEVRRLSIDCAEWNERATSAEKRLARLRFALVAGLLIIGTGLVIFIGHSVA